MGIKKIISDIIYYGLFVLVFILSIPHTLGIRNIAFYLILILAIYIFFKQKLYTLLYDFKKKLKPVIILYTLLTIWILIGIFFADNKSYVISEIKGQWFVPLLYFLLGLFIYTISIAQNSFFSKHNILFIICFALFIHVLYIDLYAFHYYIDHHIILRRFGGLEGTPDRANMLTNMLLALLAAEIIYRFKKGQQMLKVNNFILFAMLALTILSSVVEAMRNGSVAIVFIATTGIFFMLYKNHTIKKSYKIMLSVFIVLFLSAPLLYNLKTDPRWQTLIQTIPIALDTKNNLYWLDGKKYPMPKLKNGKPVNDSNYSRIAWFKVGFMYSLKHPLGIGYQRNSFGYAMQKLYGKHARSTSHSGLIDWLIGMGYPGIILWVSIVLLLFKLIIDSFKSNYSYFSIASFFILTGSMSRFIVDPILRDHMFLTFMLLLGVLISGMLMDNEKNNLS